MPQCLWKLKLLYRDILLFNLLLKPRSEAPKAGHVCLSLIDAFNWCKEIPLMLFAGASLEIFVSHLCSLELEHAQMSPEAETAVL